MKQSCKSKLIVDPQIHSWLSSIIVQIIFQLIHIPPFLIFNYYSNRYPVHCILEDSFGNTDW